MWPVTRQLMMRVYDIRPGAASESRSRLESELDWLDNKLADGRPYLVQAANELTTAANKIEQAVSKAMANELGSELGNSRNARKVIAKEMETVTKRVNAASERAHEAINMLVAKTDPKMPEDVSTAVMQSRGSYGGSCV